MWAARHTISIRQDTNVFYIMAMHDEQGGLPVARLVPKDRADRLVILRGKARAGAHVAGRVGSVLGKTLATIALCGVGLYFAATAKPRPSSYDKADFQLDSLRQYKESLRSWEHMKLDPIPTMPKFEMPSYRMPPPIRIETPSYPRYTPQPVRVQPPKSVPPPRFPITSIEK